MVTKASASCRSPTAVLWVFLSVSHTRDISAFSPSGLIWNVRALSVRTQSKVVDSGRNFHGVDIPGCRNMSDQDGDKVGWQWVQVLRQWVVANYCAAFGWICDQKPLRSLPADAG